MIRYPSNSYFPIFFKEIEKMNQFIDQIYNLIQRNILTSSTNETAWMRNIKMPEDVMTIKNTIKQYTIVENGLIILYNPQTSQPGIFMKRSSEIVKFTFNQFYGEYGKYTGVILNETGKLILKDNLIAKRLNHLNYRPDKLWRNKSTIKKKQVTGNFLKYGGHFIKLAFKGLSFIDKVELYANVLPAGHPIPTQEQIKESTINALIHLCETIEK